MTPKKLAFRLLRNSRKTDSLPAAFGVSSSTCLGPPAAAFALWRNSRKTDSLPAAFRVISSTCLAPMVAAFALLLGCAGLIGASRGGHAEYVGGTISQIPEGCGGSVEAQDEQFFVFYSKKASWRVPYAQINLLEYGQKVDRRLLAAVLISPLFLLSKHREHYLTVGYEDESGHQQAMIFRVKKNDIRAMLVSLEARTGRKVDFQDDEARRAGKG